MLVLASQHAVEDAAEDGVDVTPWCTRGHAVQPENGSELCSLGLCGDLASTASTEFRDRAENDDASPRSGAPGKASPVGLPPPSQDDHAIALSVSPVPSATTISMRPWP